MYSIPYIKKMYENRDTVYDGFSSKEDIINEFNIEDPEYLKDAIILMAIYETGWYQGDAFVLYIKDEKLYEVNAGHCSCYGLEDQWDPDEVLLEELSQNRFVNSSRFESIPSIRQTLEEVIGVGKSDPTPYKPIDPITDLELN